MIIYVLKMLLKQLCEKNPANGINGFTPLHSAALHGSLEVCQYFMENILDKSPQNIIGTVSNVGIWPWAFGRGEMDLVGKCPWANVV